MTRTLPTRLLLAAAGVGLALPLLAACGEDEPADLVIYSGRSEELVGGIIDEFEQQEDIEVDVRYGDSSELATQLVEEGDGTPSDVFFSQDAGALGVLSDEGLVAELEAEDLARVPSAYSSAGSDWAGVTGRVRVVAFDPDRVSEDEIPEDVLELASPEWAPRVAVAPTNPSFQSFVTAIRVSQGEDVARQFLEDLVANGAPRYENNLAILDALEAGEVEVGLVNHYYLHEMKQELGEENVRTQLKFMEPGTVGALVNVAGVGVIDGKEGNEHAQAFVDYLLSDDVQAEFVEVTGEYPLVDGAPSPEGLPTLEQLNGGARIDLGELHSLPETIALMTEVGLI